MNSPSSTFAGGCHEIRNQQRLLGTGRSDLYVGKFFVSLQFQIGGRFVGFFAVTFVETNNTIIKNTDNNYNISPNKFCTPLLVVSEFCI